MMAIQGGAAKRKSERYHILLTSITAQKGERSLPTKRYSLHFLCFIIILQFTTKSLRSIITVANAQVQHRFVT